MAIPKFLEDLLIISKLGDNPGADNGLSSSGLREKFDEAGVKIQKYINDTLIPALPGHFAPAGYGLGGNSKMLTSADNLDNIKADGWYTWSDIPQGISFGACVMQVKNHTQYWLVQEVTNLTPYTNCKMVRSCLNKDWQPWEWENPPMIPGVEYRTTERYNGKPVYALDMPAGTLAAKQPFSLNMGFANIDECVDCICYVGKGLVSLFEMSQWGIYTETPYKFVPDAIYGVSNSGDNLSNVKFALKYTKNTN